MPRIGLLIGLAAFLVVIVVGALAYTGYFGAFNPVGPTKPAGSTTANPPPTSAQQLVELMKEQASKGAFVATFTDKDMIKWIVASGHQLERFTLGGADAAFARFSSSVALDLTSPNWLTLGLSVPVPLPYAELYNGKTLEIGIIARSAQANGSRALAAVYATQQSGNSGWQRIPLGPEFTLTQLKYPVPKLEAGYTNPPIIVLHSDPDAEGGSVELIGLYVKVID
jgi:hypothetical protein